MLQDIEQVIREYLPEVIHMSLATVRENYPWVCEVHYVFDDELNLYFRSTAARRHSQEIALNPRVAGTIVKQHQKGEKPRGVYFEGTAALLEGVHEQHVAYRKYCERFGTTAAILDEAATDTGHKFYKITVHKFYVFDSIAASPGRKYELVWKVNG